jgi:hypothetical protein
VLADAREKGVTVVSRTTFGTNDNLFGDIEKPHVMNLRLWAEERSADKELVCSWSGSSEPRRVGPHRPIGYCLPVLDNALQQAEGVTCPCHPCRDGTPAIGTAGVPGGTALSATVKAIHVAQATRIVRDLVPHREAEQALNIARAACTLPPELGPDALQRLGHVLRSCGGRLPLGLAVLHNKEQARGAYQSAPKVELRGAGGDTLEFCPTLGGCTARRVQQALLVCPDTTGAWRPPPGYTLLDTTTGVDLFKWVAMLAGQGMWHGCLTEVSSGVWVTLASDGSNAHRWQRETIAAFSKDDYYCLWVLIWWLLVYGVVDAHPQSWADTGVGGQLVYKEGGAVESRSAQGAHGVEWPCSA